MSKNALKICSLIIVALFNLYCFNAQKRNSTSDTLSKYELVTGWPHIPGGYVLGQCSAIGIDTSQHVFLFHRAGKRWVDQISDSLILTTTVLELDQNSGEVLNSWGAGLFLMPHGLEVDKNNNVWVTDVGLHQVFKFSHDGKLLMKLG